MKVNKGGVLMITNESIVAEIVTDIPLSPIFSENMASTFVVVAIYL